MVGVRGDHQHHLRAVQCGEDAGLIILPQLVLQRDPREEYPQALGCEGIVDVLSQNTVSGAVAPIVRLLVADEHIVGFFFGRGVQNTLLEGIQHLSLLLVHNTALRVRVSAGRLIIGVGRYRTCQGTVAGGDFLPGFRIVHILHAVFGKKHTPIGFRLIRLVVHDALIGSVRPVKFTFQTVLVGTVIKPRLFIIVDGGNGLPRTAILANRQITSRRKRQVTSAHFTLDDCHSSTPPLFLYLENFHILQCEFQTHCNDLISGSSGFCCHRVQISDHILRDSHRHDGRLFGILLGLDLQFWFIHPNPSSKMI